MASAVDQLKLGLPEDVDQVVGPYLEKFDERLDNPLHGEESESLIPAANELEGLLPENGFNLPGQRGGDAEETPWQAPDWKRFAEELEGGLGISR